MQSTLKSQQKQNSPRPISWRVVYRLEWLAVALMTVMVAGILLRAISA